MERTKANLGFHICPQKGFSGMVNGFLFGKNSKPSWGKSERLINLLSYKMTFPIHAGSQAGVVHGEVHNVLCYMKHNICNPPNLKTKEGHVNFPSIHHSETLISH